MNATTSGGGFLNSVIGGLSQMVAQGLERLFGAGINAPVLGPITWADLGAFFCFVVAILALNGLAAVILRRIRKRPAPVPVFKLWRSELCLAAGKPLYLLIWSCGLYLAATPLLLRFSSDPSHPLRQLLDQLFRWGIFIAVFWLFLRLTRVLGDRLADWAGKSQNKMDDLLTKLLGRSLRLIVPVVGIILALPATGLSREYAGIVSKSSSILLIGTVAWVLFQAVHFGELAVLARYDVTAADNLQARKVYTQVHVLCNTLYVIIAIFTSASILMLFEEVRRFGASILASAGVIGIIAGFAAQRTIANLFAGFQLAMTQPIRLDDVVVIENEWGRIEEITLTYVVVNIWDERRLIVPLSQFIEKPFQNWTRVSSKLLGSVFLWVDYSLPLEETRRVVQEIIEKNPLWDRRFWNLQVTDANERAMQIRVLVTSADSAKSWDLRCEIREKLIEFIQKQHPSSLPTLRTNLRGGPPS